MQKQIWKTERRCSICKKLYMPYRENQKTCGSDECMRANKNISRKKDEKEFFVKFAKINLGVFFQILFCVVKNLVVFNTI